MNFEIVVVVFIWVVVGIEGGVFGVLIVDFWGLWVVEFVVVVVLVLVIWVSVIKLLLKLKVLLNLLFIVLYCYKKYLEKGIELGELGWRWVEVGELRCVWNVKWLFVIDLWEVWLICGRCGDLLKGN